MLTEALDWKACPIPVRKIQNGASQSTHCGVLMWESIMHIKRYCYPPYSEKHTQRRSQVNPNTLQIVLNFGGENILSKNHYFFSADTTLWP